MVRLRIFVGINSKPEKSKVDPISTGSPGVSGTKLSAAGGSLHVHPKGNKTREIISEEQGREACWKDSPIASLCTPEVEGYLQLSKSWLVHLVQGTTRRTDS